MYTVVFSRESFPRRRESGTDLSIFFFFCNLNSFSKSLPFPGKRKINLTNFIFFFFSLDVTMF